MAANLVLGRALQVLGAAGGVVTFKAAAGQWQRDRFALPGRPDLLDRLSPLLDALLDWTLYTEKPVAIADLRGSRWSQYLLRDAEPPAAGVAATPLAQRGAIWGAIAVYREAAHDSVLPLLGQLAEIATEPLSSLGAARPEGVR
jgi:GAF domain-containing protein